MISLTIPISPVPASRPRIFRNGGRAYGKKYTKFRKDCKLLVKQCKEPLQGALIAETVFYCYAPKNPANPYPVGDIDNYEKAVYDVLTRKGYYEDDKQIVKAISEKKYSDDPRIEIKLTPIEKAQK